MVEFGNKSETSVCREKQLLVKAEDCIAIYNDNHAALKALISPLITAIIFQKLFWLSDYCASTVANRVKYLPRQGWKKQLNYQWLWQMLFSLTENIWTNVRDQMCINTSNSLDRT